jgi:hypothetical protein
VKSRCEQRRLWDCRRRPGKGPLGFGVDFSNGRIRETDVRRELRKESRTVHVGRVVRDRVVEGSSRTISPPRVLRWRLGLGRSLDDCERLLVVKRLTRSASSNMELVVKQRSFPHTEEKLKVKVALQSDKRLQ